MFRAGERRAIPASPGDLSGIINVDGGAIVAEEIAQDMHDAAAARRARVKEGMIRISRVGRRAYSGYLSEVVDANASALRSAECAQVGDGAVNAWRSGVESSVRVMSSDNLPGLV